MLPFKYFFCSPAGNNNKPQFLSTDSLSSPPFPSSAVPSALIRSLRIGSIRTGAFVDPLSLRTPPGSSVTFFRLLHFPHCWLFDENTRILELIKEQQEDVLGKSCGASPPLLSPPSSSPPRQASTPRAVRIVKVIRPQGVLVILSFSSQFPSILPPPPPPRGIPRPLLSSTPLSVTKVVSSQHLPPHPATTNVGREKPRGSRASILVRAVGVVFCGASSSSSSSSNSSAIGRVVSVQQQSPPSSPFISFPFSPPTNPRGATAITVPKDSLLEVMACRPVRRDDGEENDDHYYVLPLADGSGFVLSTCFEEDLEELVRTPPPPPRNVVTTSTPAPPILYFRVTASPSLSVYALPPLLRPSLSSSPPLPVGSGPVLRVLPLGTIFLVHSPCPVRCPDGTTWLRVLPFGWVFHGSIASCGSSSSSSHLSASSSSSSPPPPPPPLWSCVPLRSAPAVLSVSPRSRWYVVVRQRGVSLRVAPSVSARPNERSRRLACGDFVRGFAVLAVGSGGVEDDGGHQRDEFVVTIPPPEFGTSDCAQILADAHQYGGEEDEGEGGFSYCPLTIYNPHILKSCPVLVPVDDEEVPMALR